MAYIYIAQKFNLFADYLFVEVLSNIVKYYLKYIKLLISNIPYIEMSTFFTHS